VPDKAELPKYYESYYTHIAEKSYFRKKIDRISEYIIKLHFFSNRKFIRQIINFLLPTSVKNLFVYEIYNLKFREKIRIFDVGFGNGNFISKMVKLGIYPDGCDFDKKCVQLVKDSYGVKAYHGALADIATDGKYDVLTYGHVVEHLYNLREEFMTAKEKLNENGQIVGLTPNIESWGHKLFKKNWRGLEPPRHLHLYSMKSLRKIAEDCGFKVAELKTTSRYARHILAASIMIKLNRKASVSGGGRGIWIALAGYILQICEWVINVFKRNAGEEIFFVFELK
jgi:2-polyprenyl-3-methyl-5-hydroxy-6-metoxy-1,4-benzoquinol methylase